MPKAFFCLAPRLLLFEGRSVSASSSASSSSAVILANRYVVGSGFWVQRRDFRLAAAASVQRPATVFSPTCIRRSTIRSYSNSNNMSNEEVRNVTILGTGPCGLTAALYTARANLRPLVLHGDTPGGQLTTTTEVENYPGFVQGIDGNELISNMTQQAERFGTEYRYGTVKQIRVPEGRERGKEPLELVLAGGGETEEVVKTKTLIVATGARPRKLGLPSEDEYWSKGVTSCATCDGFFFRGKEVCVIGGGDSAMEEATYLTRHCPKVYVIHRRDKLRASKIMADRALTHPKIEVVWNAVVQEILGDKEKKPFQVTGVRLKDTVTNESKVLAVEGVFLAIGHIPNTDCLQGVIELDENGYAVTKPKSTATSVPGLFVAGDAQDHVYRQAITAAGTGCMAAIEAERWLEMAEAQAAAL
ncbi:Thioredoxin reductase [Balamuthia mandrillaris]